MSETLQRHPLATAWDEWIKSDEGNVAADASTLHGDGGVYLSNRLHRAFTAGARAAEDSLRKRIIERVEKMRDGLEAKVNGAGAKTNIYYEADCRRDLRIADESLAAIKDV